MTNAGYFERNVAPLNGSGSSLPDSATSDRPARNVLAGDSGNMNMNMNMGGCNMDMGAFTGNMDMSSFGNMDMGFSGGGRSVSVETTTINGRTIEKTTVVENGVTTVTTREF